MEENRRVLRLLGLDSARAALRPPPPMQKPRSALPKKSQVRKDPHGTRGLTQKTEELLAAGRRPQIKFACLAVRGLYQEIDELLRQLLLSVFDGQGHAGDDADDEELPDFISNLLTKEPTDGLGEFSVVILFVEAEAVGCAFYRHPPVDLQQSDGQQSTRSGTEIRLLVVKPGLHAAHTALAHLLLGFVGIVAARQYQDQVHIDAHNSGGGRLTLGCSHETLVAIRQPPESLCVALAETETNEPVIDFFFDLSNGLGPEAEREQTSYMQKAVLRAERALGFDGGAAPAGDAGRAYCADEGAYGPELPGVGDHIVLWADKSTLASVGYSQHFLAVLTRQQHQELSDGTSASTTPSMAAVAGSIPSLVLEFRWVGGTDDGSTISHKACNLQKRTPAEVADREMSLVCGYGIDEAGCAFKVQLTWCQLAVAVGTAGWRQLLEAESELRAPCAGGLVVHGKLAGRPELLFGWQALDLLAQRAPAISAAIVVRRALAYQQLRRTQSGGGSSSGNGSNDGVGSSGGGGSGGQSSCRGLYDLNYSSSEEEDDSQSAAASAAARGARNAPKEEAPLRMLEFFCGEAPLAVCARESHGFR